MQRGPLSSLAAESPLPSSKDLPAYVVGLLQPLLTCQTFIPSNIGFQQGLQHDILPPMQPRA